MAIRNILKEDDQRLRKKSRAVTEFNERLWTLLDDMYETMVDEGVGLAAPQVGVLRQAVVIDVGEGKWELVNPEIVSEEGEQCDTEGCLSIPGVWGVVRRPGSASRSNLMRRTFSRSPAAMRSTTFRASSLPTGPNAF